MRAPFRLAHAVAAVLGWAALALLAAGAFGLLVFALRVATYAQHDDAVHLAAKRSYLERIAAEAPAPGAPRPNIVIVLFDDLGYGDLGVYGARSIATPHIDALAGSGTRLTRYSAPSSVCSPSRAGLLTGRHPPAAGVPEVLFPEGSRISDIQKASGLRVRIPAEEILLPEVLRAAGYRTAMVGKWHLGDVSPSLPNELGFESFFGALYSNDMTPFALYRDAQVAVPAPVDQRQLDAAYTREAVSFIERSGDEPFFLYFAHSFPHVPLFASPERSGRSQGGLYGDVVEGLDAGVGAIVEALDRRGLRERTLILLTSDNGPWYEGSPGGLRGRKNQSWEGGMRVPFIAAWPGRIPAAASSDLPVSGIDVFPTLLARLGLPLPDDREIDGRDAWDAWQGTARADAAGPGDRLLYAFTGERLDAVADARFKLHRRRGVRVADFGDSFSLLAPQGPWLFDLALDRDESYDTSQRHPEVFARLQAAFDAMHERMRTNPRGWR